MALQVWLPLINNTNNQGLSPITITNNGATVATGKLGNCYKLANTIVIGGITDLTNINSTVCFWAKTDATSSWQKISTYGSHNIYFADTARVKIEYTPSVNIATPSIAEWHHYAFTITDGSSKGYRDGQLIATSTEAVTSAAITSVTLGVASSSMYINDYRIYNEVLSDAQIKEISKGLIAHYKLDSSDAGNMIINGYGKEGSVGWTAAPNTSTIPDVSGCVGSFISSWQNNFVEIDNYGNYTLNAYTKSTGTATSYPSICGYDVDYKAIMTFNCADGFHSTARTTLAQPLKPGDTVVYCTDLTNFTTATNNYYYHLAIFGYRDSTGRLYPDYGYTADSPVFGSYSDKSKIDKTNNTITLNSAFTGNFRPAGTVVCQATEGNTYVYPWGGIPSTSTDWVSRTWTFVPNNSNRLRYAKYLKYYAYQNCYQACIELIRNDIPSSVVVDSSGYGNNGTIGGTLSSSSNTARYKLCKSFNAGLSNYIACGSGPKVTDSITYAMWIFLDSNATQFRPISCTENGGWNFETNTAPIADTDKLRAAVYTNGAYLSAITNITIANIRNSWHHLAATFDGQNLKMYVDGILCATASNTSKNPIGYHASNGIFIGAEAGPNTTTPAADRYWDGKLSDVRIYATALSETDIKELYNLGARIDNTNNYHTLEIIEHKPNILMGCNIALHNKTYTDGLNNYVQSNCQVTLTDDGLRIYRPPNINPTDNGNTMWGGLRIQNLSNRFNLTKGHRYAWGFKISGQSTNLASFQITNQMGWGGGGLNPSPSNTFTQNITTNFQGENAQVWHMFTINDDVWKECTTAYSGFVAGNYYVSYRDFGYGFGYQDTGSLGTDIYLTDFRMFDITDVPLENITKAGVSNFMTYLEDQDIASIKIDKSLLMNSILEI